MELSSRMMTDLRVGPIRVEETTGFRMPALRASLKSAFISFARTGSMKRERARAAECGGSAG
ncbi:Uncharacterized protein pbN1_34860 [Aromatoleum bremense]|nr:Uncharacterized protein pbN1_34860 [Aromatoleum bremense]